MKSRILIPIFVIIFLATAVNAFVISGQVTDVSSNPINNSHVEVFDTSSILINDTYTNSTGDYSVYVGNTTALRIVNASAAGFNTGSTPIFVNSSKTVNFALGPVASVYLSGYVTDNSTSSPLNNVDMKIKQGGATVVQTYTNPSGFYNVSLSNGSSYDVTASLITYNTETSTVIINGNTELNFTLSKPAGCVESWSCTAWSTCSGGVQTRVCTDSNSCGTEFSKPAESQSCSSSSGGGGSSYTGKTYTIQLIPEGVTQRVREKDRIKFNFKGEEHQVEVEDISTTAVDLNVDSFNAILGLENIGKYDLNEDDIYDLKINVTDISYSRVTLAFYLINEPIKPPAANTTTTTTSGTYVYTPPPEPKPDKQIIVEDILPGKDQEDSGKQGIFSKAFGLIKRIPYIGYVAAGILILSIIIVAIKFFKAEEDVDLSNFSKDQLKRRVARLEKQIAKLKKTL